MVEDKDSHLSGVVIGAAIEVHRHLGPGLLESAYETCLCRELELQGLSVARQVPLPVIYKGLTLDCGYRLDLVMNDELIVELKAVDGATRSRVRISASPPLFFLPACGVHHRARSPSPVIPEGMDGSGPSASRPESPDASAVFLPRIGRRRTLGISGNPVGTP
jgi:GxxExxY protein